MADLFRPLTLLLGSAFLWSLCLLVLALAGLGGRFSDGAPGAEPPPIPKVTLTRTESRLGPLGNYLEVGTRPLMMADRRPGRQPDADGGGTDELDVMLTSVLITARLQAAIFTNTKDNATRRVRMGENIEGSNWRLVQLAPRSAVVEGPSGQRTLELRVFNGVGGQAPTPVATAVVALPPAPPSNQDGDGAKTPVSPMIPMKPQQPVRLPSTPVQAQAQRPPQAGEAPVSQEQQVEAIRRRIEARRAQMRAEADADSANNK